MGSSPTWATITTFGLRGAVRSAGLLVTQEVAASSPAGDALENTARYANRQSGPTTLRVVPETLVTCRFDSDLRHSEKQKTFVGWALARPKWL